MQIENKDMISKEVRRYLRDVADHQTEAADQIASYDEKLNSLVQAALARVGMQQNTDMRKMAAWAGIWRCPPWSPAIYGMNFQFMPELNWTWGYPADPSATCMVLRLPVLVSATSGTQNWLCQPRALAVPAAQLAFRLQQAIRIQTSTPSLCHAWRIASAPLSRTQAASVAVMGVADRKVTGSRGGSSGKSGMSLWPNNTAVNGTPPGRPCPQRRAEVDQCVGDQHHTVDSRRCRQDRQAAGEAADRSGISQAQHNFGTRAALLVDDGSAVGSAIGWREHPNDT